MNFNSKRKIALVGPNFFSYIQAIKDVFIEKGYEAYFYDERHSNSVLAKIAYRLHLKSLVQVQRDNHIKNILEDILARSITDVILIDIEVIDSQFVANLKKHKIRVHIYMWDSAKNKSSFLKILPLCDSKASFEPIDCKNHNMVYIPLFAEDMFSQLSHGKLEKREKKLIFSGTLHSQRVRLLLKLRRILQNSQFDLREFTFYHSRLLFFAKSLFDIKGVKLLTSFRTKGFSKHEIADAYLRSMGVIDIHHPGQDGLTSRTFETLRSGARLITLNQTALSLPAILQDRILVLDNIDDLEKKLSIMEKELAPIDQEMDYFLSIDRFVVDLENLAHLATT